PPGGLIRDNLGRCFQAFCCNLGKCSISRAELHGMATGLRVAWDAGYRRVVVQSDSTTALALIAAEGEPLHQHANEVLNIRNLLNRDWTTSLLHVFREANKVADFLVPLGHKQQIGNHSCSISYCNLGYFLRLDCMGISESRLVPD
ncbi:Putative ribonuclease H protein At1g65750, partial [Linum perenne]